VILFRQHSESGRSGIIFSLISFFCFFVIFGAAANAAQKGVWQADNLEAAFVSEIRGERETKTADKNGNIIEVKVKVRPSASSGPNMKIKDIMLEGKTIANNRPEVWKLKPVGIGIVGNNNACFYQFPHTLIKGMVGMSVASAGEFKLSREKEGAPAVITLVKSPTHICLAFVASKGGIGKMKLHLANNRFPVSVINKKK
jgi:hypothetical protein